MPPRAEGARPAPPVSRDLATVAALLESRNDGLQLLLTDFGGFTSFTFLEGFTDAENDAQAGVKSGTRLLSHEFRGFLEDCSTLRVT